MTKNQKNDVPVVNPNYIPWGNHDVIETVIKNGGFFPIYIYGLTGCGKTLMVEQVCAKLNRPMYRVNINVDTDADDLIGGFRLVNGDTVWQDGPVVTAAKEGAVLLLDEIDLGTIRMMCLQSILEGNGIFINKTSTWVHPAPGFTIIATANTKGRGDDTAKYLGTNVHNEAMLERFPVTLVQPYPDNATESKILLKKFDSCGMVGSVVESYVSKLVKWAAFTRKAYESEGAMDYITTRRLCQIAQTYSMFRDEIRAIEYCLNRFDEEVGKSFMITYKKLNNVL